MSYPRAKGATKVTNRILTAQHVRWGHKTGCCPVCGAPHGYWPDGVPRITCGAKACFLRWVPSRKEEEEEGGE